MLTNIKDKIINGLESHINNWNIKNTEEWLTGCAKCPYNNFPRDTDCNSCIYNLLKDILCFITGQVK